MKIIKFLVFATIVAIACFFSCTSDPASKNYDFQAENSEIIVTSFDWAKEKTLRMKGRGFNITERLSYNPGSMETPWIERLDTFYFTTRYLDGKKTEDLCKVDFKITSADYPSPSVLNPLYNGFKVKNIFYSKRGIEKMEIEFEFRVYNWYETAKVTFRLPDSETQEIIKTEKY